MAQTYGLRQAPLQSFAPMLVSCVHASLAHSQFLIISPSVKGSSSSSSSADSDRDDHGTCVLPGPGRLGDETGMWKTFKFTPIFNHLRVTIGWECRCSRPNHRARGMAACSRTFRFAAHGGRGATERSLKWWCQQAFATGSRGDHMKMPAEDAAGNLPSLAALEAWRPP